MKNSSTTQFLLEDKLFEVIDPGKPLTESDIKTFEAKIGIRLPSQLRHFYLRWNGGLPCPIDIPDDKSAWVRLHWTKEAEASEGRGGVTFSGLFEINSTPGLDFLCTWHDFKNNIPTDCIGFGRNSGSSLYLIGIKEYNLGKIFFWESSYQADIAEGEIPSYDNIAFVANSFTEFLIALREEPDEGESLEDWVQRVYEK
jgi:hypothetical protein